MRPGHLRWRRHWKAPIAFVLLVGTLLVAGAGIRVRPVVSAGGALPPREPIQNITNDVDLFDSSLVHRIDVQIDPEDRARMLEAYREDNDKIVVPATVTIDGVEIPGAGIRLKGNSSLWGVSDGGDFGGPDGDGEFVGGPGGGDWEAFDAAFNECMDDQGLGDIFGGFGPPSDGAEGFDPNELPDGAVVMNPEDLPEGAIVMGPDGEFPEDGFDGGFEGGFDGFPQTLHSATGDDFAAPYLIVINHTNDQLRYQGLSQIALRTDGNGTILAEPVTIAAYEKAGIPAPQTALAGLSINGDDELLYGVTSVLDQEYVDRHFGGADGALFKATALQSQTFAYEGEDQSKYDGFEQVTAKNRHDKASLIDLLRFTQDATADEFAAGAAEATGMEDVIFGGPGGAIGDDGEEFLDENGDPIEGDPFGGANRLVERFMEVPEFAQAYEDARAELSETLFGRGFVAEELARQIAVVNDALTDRPSLAPEDALTTQNESLTRFVDERADHLGA